MKYYKAEIYFKINDGFNLRIFEECLAGILRCQFLLPIVDHSDESFVMHTEESNEIRYERAKMFNEK